MQHGAKIKSLLALGMALSLSLPLITDSHQVLAAKSIRELEQGKQQAQNELSVLDNELVDLLASINVLEQNIEENRNQIADVKDELKAARAAEAKQYEDMKVRVRYMYENGNESIFTMLLESGSIADFLNRVSYAKAVYEYDRGLLASYEATAEAIGDMEVALKAEQKELAARESELRTKQGSLNAMIATKRSEIANFDSQLRAAREAAARRAAEIARREAEARARANAAAVSRQAEIERRRQEEEARRRQEQERLEVAKADTDEEHKAASEADPAEEKSATTSTTIEKESKKKTAQESVESDEDEDIIEQTSGTVEDEEEEIYDGTVEDEEEYYDGGSSDDYDDYIDVYDEEEDDSYDTESAQSSTSVSGSSVASYASQFVGNPYVWGGNSLTSGCDCSGFVVQVYSHFGIDLSATRTSGALEGVGQSVSYENIQPGDIVCYPGHVAIYAGGGRIVEAQSSKTGITSNRSVTCSSITAIRRVV